MAKKKKHNTTFNENNTDVIVDNNIDVFETGNKEDVVIEIVDENDSSESETIIEITDNVDNEELLDDLNYQLINKFVVCINTNYPKDTEIVLDFNSGNLNNIKNCKAIRFYNEIITLNMYHVPISKEIINREGINYIGNVKLLTLDEMCKQYPQKDVLIHKMKMNKDLMVCIANDNSFNLYDTKVDKCILI